MSTDIQFGMVPAWFLELRPSDRAVSLYAHLAATFDFEKNNAAGIEWLAKDFGKSETWIKRGMAELVEIGAVTRHRRLGTSTLTVVHRLPQSARIRPASQVENDLSDGSENDPQSRPINYPDLDIQKEEPSSSEPTELEKDFKEFYAAFPIRREPDYAERKYRAARKKATHAEIMAGIGPYVAHVERRRANGFEGLEFQAPGAWLNKGRWADEYEVQPADTDERRRIEKARRSMSADQRAAAKSLAAFPYDEQSAQIMGESKEVDNVSSNNGSKAP